MFRLEINDVPVKLAVHPLNDERIAPTASGRAHERASIAALRLLLESEQEGSPSKASP